MHRVFALIVLLGVACKSDPQASAGAPAPTASAPPTAAAAAGTLAATPCYQCLAAACAAEVKACDANEGCRKLHACQTACPADPQTLGPCVAKCGLPGDDAKAPFESLSDCTDRHDGSGGNADAKCAQACGA